jgi:hypothetical protein
VRPWPRMASLEGCHASSSARTSAAFFWVRCQAVARLLGRLTSLGGGCMPSSCCTLHGEMPWLLCTSDCCSTYKPAAVKHRDSRMRRKLELPILASGVCVTLARGMARATACARLSWMPAAVAAAKGFAELDSTLLDSRLLPRPLGAAARRWRIGARCGVDRLGLCVDQSFGFDAAVVRSRARLNVKGSVAMASRGPQGSLLGRGIGASRCR